MAYYLGQVKQAYENRLDQNNLENYDETHFVFDSEDGWVLYFMGTKRISYSDLSSGRKKFTVCQRISGGISGKIEVPFCVFKNRDRNYPIVGVPDNVDGIMYRTQSKGWMNRTLFLQCFATPEFITALPGNRTHIVYVDNCVAHDPKSAFETALNAINTRLERFPRSCTHLIQTLDQMVLRAFKALFRKKSNTKRAEQGLKLAYTSTGRLTNPGKYYYLTLVKDCVDELNARMSGDISIARKSMIMCGLIPDVDGAWRVEQLTKNLQEIVNQKMNYFNGLHPSQ